MTRRTAQMVRSSVARRAPTARSWALTQTRSENSGAKAARMATISGGRSKGVGLRERWLVCHHRSWPTTPWICQPIWPKSRQYEQTGQPQRSFLLIEYQAESWPAPQPVVIKVEAQAQGTNRRAVVTNRPGCQVLPHAVYDEYAMRGESENRNKELKTELQADRLSDHRFLANFFRLYLHAAALNLLVRLRHAVVQSPPTSAELSLPAELPTEAIDEPNRKRFFNARRERDPLGGGFACTWRTRLIKVAAEVITRARRVLVRLSGSWPHLDHFLQVSQAVSRPPAQSSPT